MSAGSSVALGLGGLVLDALGGAWFGSALVPASSGTIDDARAPAVETKTSPDLESAGLAQPATARHAASADESTPADCPLFGEVQRAHGIEGIRAGWKSVRSDECDEASLLEGLARYEQNVRTFPRFVGRELGEAANAKDAALEDARRGGLFALLKSLEEKPSGPLFDEIRDAKWFDAFFARSTVGGSVADGASNRGAPDKVLEDGATLSFPAGVFRVFGLMRERDPFPRDVTISGAGIDATMLVLQNALSTRGELVSLTVRDCTIHTQGHYLTDLRSNPASITFERVRFVGFDSGGGASCLFATRSAAIRAFDCQILGGYGRSPRHGRLFDVRTDALLARFDRCRFELLHVAQSVTARATVLLVGCTLVDLLDPGAVATGNPAAYGLDGCTVGYLPGGADAAPKKDLNELFPDWEKSMVR